MTAVPLPTPRGVSRIDRDALHRYLHRRTDHFGRYRVNLRELAEELDLNYTNLSEVITGMAHEGRLRRIAGSPYGPKTYRVEDPSIFATPPAPARPRRRHRW